MPAVTVCVPTYNGEEFLKECLDSILRQTFENFELLIVDDCSKDATVAIAERYASTDSRVRVVKNAANRGLVGNWNTCVQLAASEWIKFVFQDDFIAPDCLEVMMAEARAEVRMISCARDFVFDEETKESDKEFYRWHQRHVASVYEPKSNPSGEEFAELVLRHLGSNLLGEPTAVLFHKSVADLYGAFNPYLIHECDNEFWVRVATNTGTMHVRETLATFRVHGASTTAHNKGPRQLRKQLDPVLMRHDFAFHSAYARLRQVARNRRPRVDLQREFWHFANATVVRGNVIGRILAADDRASAEMTAVLAAYPRLRALRVNFVISLFRSFPARAMRVASRIVRRAAR